MKHGLTGYNYRKCRCDICVEANRARRRRQRARKAPPSHGTVSGYFNYGCRCDPCKVAGAEENARRNADRGPDSPEAVAARRARNARRQDETLDRADHRYQEWTGAEMELAMRDDIAIREIALMLGRTYAAVTNMRKKIRNEPKYRSAAGVSDTDADR